MRLWQRLRRKCRQLLGRPSPGWRMGTPSTQQFRSRVAERVGEKVVAVKAWTWQDDTRETVESPIDGLNCFDERATIADGCLARLLETSWKQLGPGRWLAFSSGDAPHAVIAIATAVGWLLEDHFAAKGQRGTRVFVLRKGRCRNELASGIDWLEESRAWTVSGGEIGALKRPRHTPVNNAERRCHVFGVAMAKSGSRSIAGLFSKGHAAHEFEAVETIALLDGEGGDLENRMDLTRWVRERDERSGFLECDSSQLHHWYLEALVSAFPDARFLLTWREPQAWLESFVNHRLARGLSPDWEPLERLRFGVPAPERTGVFGRYGLADMEKMLSFWSCHHRRVLESVPRERLLVLELSSLQRSLDRVARFAGVPSSWLSADEGRKNQRQADFHLFRQMPAGAVEDAVSRICGTEIERLLDLSHHDAC